MHVAGIDIGSATTKAVVLHDYQVMAAEITETLPDSQAGAEDALGKALARCRLERGDLLYIVATGYGRINVPFADRVITEIACHARGVHFLFPQARTVLDMGGQDCKAIRIDGSGNHLNFVMNDKCAAGTGRFLEMMARTLRVPINELGPLSLQATEATPISSVCAVFARSEVVRHLRKGVPRANIAAGLHEATADRVVGLLRRVGIEPDFVISGGIGKNVGVVKRVEAKLGLSAGIAPEPQTVGALGAALFAVEAVHGA